MEPVALLRGLMSWGRRVLVVEDVVTRACPVDNLLIQRRVLTRVTAAW
jgi:hypothetical protein